MRQILRSVGANVTLDCPSRFAAVSATLHTSSAVQWPQGTCWLTICIPRNEISICCADKRKSIEVLRNVGIG